MSDLRELAARLREDEAGRLRYRRRGCEICDAAVVNPEAFWWVEEQLLLGELTQQEIAAGACGQGLEITQSQVSVHKRRHFDPRVAEWRESAQRQAAALAVLGTLEPEQMALVEAQMALVDARQRLAECDDPELAAKLHGSIARLSAVVDRAAVTPLELEKLDLINRQKAALAAQEEAKVRELVVAWVREHKPRLLPEFAEVDPGAEDDDDADPDPAPGDEG